MRHGVSLRHELERTATLTKSPGSLTSRRTVTFPRRTLQVSRYAVPMSMLLPSAVFALLTVGFVIPCLIDIATTPTHHFDVPSKQMWLVVAAVFWVFGAAAWLLIGRRDVRMRAVCDELTGSWKLGAEYSLWATPRRAASGYRPGASRSDHRMPVASARFIAPDDNPHFLLELERRIREGHEDA
jgi:hypothetical protein